MSERLTYWKCDRCYGTGKIIVGFGADARTSACERCDGTGNALVHGTTGRHKRRIAEIEQRQSNN